MQNVILTTGNKNLVEVDYLQQDDVTNTVSCQSCVVKSDNTEDISNLSNVISNNPLVQYDNLLQEDVNITNLKQSIFGSIPVDYSSTSGNVLSDKNCIINEEEVQCINNSYTKEEIADILSNYYTKEEVTKILNNIDLTTGEESTFYIDGLIIKEELPTSDTQIPFTISNDIPTEKIFSLKFSNNFILHAGSLFNL